MDFQTAKAQRVAELQASVDAFKPRSKPDRERYVIEELLTNLRITFRHDELVPVPQNQDPPDIKFRDAQFEIKEFVDVGRRRHQEYKDALARAQAATTMADLSPPVLYQPRDVTLIDLATEVVAQAATIAYDPRTMAGLDLAVYYNLMDVIGLVDSTTCPPVPALVAQGWRSVSVLFGHRTIVLHVRSDAPTFLHLSNGCIAHR